MLPALPLDLHVLGLPLAFILSQDQTLHSRKSFLFLIVFLVLRWTLFVYAAICSVFFIHSHYSRSKSFYLICCGLGLPRRRWYSVFHSPLPFGWGCKSNALFSISKLPRNFFSFLPSCRNPRRCSHSRSFHARRYSLKAGAKVIAQPFPSKYISIFFR